MADSPRYVNRSVEESKPRRRDGERVRRVGGYREREESGDARRDRRDATLLVYGAGSNQVPIIEVAQREGFRVVAIDRDATAPGAVRADRFHCISLRDHDAIRAATRDEPIRGVVARITDAAGLASAHAIARERGLPTACPALVEAATSKRALAAICQSAGLRTPPRLRPEDPIAPGGGPVLVRPDITLRGKAGIRRVVHFDELENAVTEASASSANGRIDVARWIDGYDVSVLVELDRGRAHRHAIWDEWVAVDEAGRIQGIGCGLPSRFEIDCAEIDGLVEQIGASFAASRCLVVVSLRVDPSGRPHLIEIHLGLGGDGIAERLLPAAWPDWDAFACLVRVETGESTAGVQSAPRPCALVRGDDGWRLVEAANVETLHGRVRASLRADWEWPLGLRSGASAFAPAGTVRPGTAPATRVAAAQALAAGSKGASS